METNEVIRRRRLPHWDVPSAAYFVTVCLEGSIPAKGLLDLENDRAEQRQLTRPTDQSPAQWAIATWKRTFARLDRWLDQEPAVRHLEDPRLARIVVNSMYHFAETRYELLSFVVMPSHYHWVFQPLPEWADEAKKTSHRSPREVIMHSLNRQTARDCNLVLGRQGTFWQHESYDHWIRDSDELERIMQYVEGNPVKAGLASLVEEWPFSSAHDRQKHGLAFGEPLASR